MGQYNGWKEHKQSYLTRYLLPKSDLYVCSYSKLKRHLSLKCDQMSTTISIGVPMLVGRILHTTSRKPRRRKQDCILVFTLKHSIHYWNSSTVVRIRFHNYLMSVLAGHGLNRYQEMNGFLVH
jgi:hypothetical protein